MEEKRRWYDNDPLLKEAFELLSLSPEDDKDEAANFILKLQEQVAAEVIDKIYETVSKYHMKGNRWYDKDPVMIRAIELLKIAPPQTQRIAAKKLLKALSEGDMSELKIDETDQ